MEIQDLRTLKISACSVYGRELIYPINATALELVKLTGRKTFKPHDIEVLKALGFKINWEIRRGDMP